MSKSIFPLPMIDDFADASTLGEHIAAGYQIRARCTHAGCNHNVQINLVVVARYLGIDHGASAEDLKPYFYCPPCRTAGVNDGHIVFAHYPPTAPHCVIAERWIADRTAA
ncbi:MAG: hypothetical protein M9924_06020 [Rhizobiaceae bacterium]|nr:hypothetical protein [Rhizobiaceae bacterium]